MPKTAKILPETGVDSDFEDLYEHVLQSITDGITVQDSDGRLLFANDAAARYSGMLTGKEMISKDWEALNRENRARYILSDEKGNAFNFDDLPGRKVLAGENFADVILRVTDTKGNTISWMQIKAWPIEDRYGHRRAVNIFSNVSERKQLEKSLEFKAEASRLLYETRDMSKTLQHIATIAVETIADWCAVDLVTDEGKLESLALVHKDPEKIKWGYELRRKFPPDLSASTGLAKVLRTGKSEYYPSITEEMIKNSNADEEHMKIIRELGLSSIMIVPMILPTRRVIGAIQFVNTESHRHFTAWDLQMAEQLASRAALAIENARLYKEIESEKERLNNLLATVPSVVWEAYGRPDSAKQRVDFVSEYVTNMLGYTVDEWLNTPNFWLLVVHPEDKDRAGREAAEIFASKKGGVSRFRWLRKDGEPIWVEAHSFVVLDDVGNPVGMRGVTMDISERMLQEQRKDEFISIASHELKTPLTSVKMLTEYLKKKAAKEDRNMTVTHLEKMDQQLIRLGKLVEELLEATRFQKKDLELKVERFSLANLVAEVVDMMQGTTQKHMLKFSGIMDLYVLADKDRISQVLINLISNAIKYSPDSKNIDIQMENNNGFVIISVQDNGIGIDANHIPNLFESFYRVENGDSRHFPGLGLGLYICQRIVRRHGGKVWVKSKVGHGSTFYFSLPIAA